MATGTEARAAPSEWSWTPADTLFLLFMANVLSVADRALPGIVVDPVNQSLRYGMAAMAVAPLAS